MHLDPYLEQVRTQLRAAAALGDERTQQVAAALAESASAAVRLAVINALSDASAEINAGLLDTPGTGAPTISLSLDGENVKVTVTRLPEEGTAPAPSDDGEATARISLRLSEQLKAEIERAADAESISTNTWLVRAARSALTHRRGHDSPTGRGAHRITGWVTG